MADVIEKMIDNAYWPPRGSKPEKGGRKNPNNFQYYRKWGFTIFRTCYSQEYNEAWQMLLYSLRHQTKLAFGAFDKDEDVDQDDVQQLKDLFYLEVREDPAQLDGLDVRGLREFCEAEKLRDSEVVVKATSTKLHVTTRPIESQGMADLVFDFVLLADEAVLNDVASGEFIVKAVSLQWKDGDSTWGWMRIPTGYLLELWTLLTWNEFRTEIALHFDGPEEELHHHIWPGDMGLVNTGRFSEIRRRKHYSNQNDRYMA